METSLTIKEPETSLETIAQLAKYEIIIPSVIDQVTELNAANLLSAVRKRIKEIEIERISWTRPLEEIKKRFIAKANEYLQPLKNYEQALETELLWWRQKQESLRRKEEARLLALQEKRNERAAEKGKPPPLPETIIPYVAGPDKTVRTETGKLTYTKHWKATLVDINQVPLFFNGAQILKEDMTAVQRLISAGVREIPGFEIKEEINTRIQ